MRNTASGWIAFSWFAVLALGCNEAPEGRMQVYRTSGKVQIDGQPAVGVKVVLYGATPELQGPGTVAPYGVSDSDGEFELTSYDAGDGAPAGEFTVTAYWPEPIPEGADEEFYQPKDRLGGKYTDPIKSSLKVTIEEHSNELPTFDLES